MSDEDRLIVVLVLGVAATTTGEPLLTAAAGFVTWVLLRLFRLRRDTWNATEAHRRRMKAMRKHPSRWEP